mgnify:CR=1 FL=1
MANKVKGDIGKKAAKRKGSDKGEKKHKADVAAIRPLSKHTTMSKLSTIKNKVKRQELYKKLKQAANKEKAKEKEVRQQSVRSSSDFDLTLVFLLWSYLN